MNFSSKFKYKQFFLIIIIFLIFINLPIFSQRARNFFYLISEPIQKNIWGRGNSFFNYLKISFNIKETKEENEYLKVKIQELLVENIELLSLKQENETLRKALEMNLNKEFNLVAADVTAKYLDQDSILINKGLKDGITENSAVINQQKSLIGRVDKLYDDFANVRLISDKESVFDVEILRNEGDKILGLIHGMGGFNLSLDLISQEKEIKEKDVVFTSSFGGNFPSGLLVGEIEEAKRGDVEPFWQIKIKSAFDIKNLETVFIIIK